MKFYATVARGWLVKDWPNIPTLFPASSWWNGKRFILPKPIDHLSDVALDCGGFVAARIWGDYRYSQAAYLDWCQAIRPQWAAMRDWCCEDEITTGNVGIVRSRQERTTEESWRTWEQAKSAPFRWLPTIQGYYVADYLRHLADLRPLLDDMSAHYGPAFRVGIGTLCRRERSGEVESIVSALSDAAPALRWHLWGVKTRLSVHPHTDSTDSAAWNGLFGAEIEEWRRSGLTLRSYARQVSLPSYLARIERAGAQPRLF